MLLRFREGNPPTRSASTAEAECRVNARSLADFFHGALHGPVITKLLSEDGELDVRMRFPGSQRRDIGEVLNYSLPGASGALVPARELVTLEETVEPTKIWRRNGRRCVYLTAKIGSLSYEEAERSITAALQSVPFPSDYGYEFDESVAAPQCRQEDMAVLVGPLDVFVVHVLPRSSNRSFLALVIMTTVPWPPRGDPGGLPHRPPVQRAGVYRAHDSSGS